VAFDHNPAMVLPDDIRAAYMRMLSARAALDTYAIAGSPDKVEFRRLFARLQAATDEYFLLVSMHLEKKYPPPPFGDERSA
jgi:hypothetical protein